MGKNRQLYKINKHNNNKNNKSIRDLSYIKELKLKWHKKIKIKINNWGGEVKEKINRL